jgi:hypothetical protein
VSAYADKLTGRTIAGVSTAQIYRGAVSFILLQVIMVTAVVMFPDLAITKAAPEVDPTTIDIQIPESGTGVEDDGGGIPPPPSFD